MICKAGSRSIYKDVYKMYKGRKIVLIKQWFLDIY